MTVSRGDLTTKEDLYIRNLAERNFPAKLSERAKCAEDAGYANPHDAVRLIDDRPRVREILEYEMDHQGLTVKKAVAKHVELFDCIHPLSKEERPDNLAQLNALTLFYKIRDAYPATKVEIDKREEKTVTHRFEDMHKRAAEIKGKDYVDGELVETYEDVGPTEPI